jgi:hypothetical protein
MDKIAMFYAVRQDLIALAARVGFELHSKGCPTLETAMWVIKVDGVVTNQFDPESLDNLIDLLEAKLRPRPN